MKKRRGHMGFCPIRHIQHYSPRIHGFWSVSSAMPHSERGIQKEVEVDSPGINIFNKSSRSHNPHNVLIIKNSLMCIIFKHVNNSL